MQELNKNKPRGKADDILLAEITRLEPALAVARDDLVSNPSNIVEVHFVQTDWAIERMQASSHRYQRRDEAYEPGTAGVGP